MDNLTCCENRINGIWLYIANMKKQIYTLTNKAFVEWLKSQRESKGLTVRQVGEIIERDFSIISKVETQVRRMDVAEFYEYCELLELDPHDCFRFIKEKKRSLKNNDN
jgi:transcriptional regulator with XRE-family HTH domain